MSERITAQIFGTSSPVPSTPGSPTISIHPPEDEKSLDEQILASPPPMSLKGKEREIIQDEDDEPLAPKLDKGKGKEVVAPPRAETAPLPPTPTQLQPTVVYAGVAFPVHLVPVMFNHARTELPLRAIQIPVLGEYKDTFTGAEFTMWLRDNVRGFGGSLDVAEVAARELTERDGMLRRIGELGKWPVLRLAHFCF